MEHPTLYYYLKNSCMNKNESRMFYYINCALDEFFPDLTIRNNYIVFPQVSMFSFLGINDNLNKFSTKVALQILSKNFDFIICNRYYAKNYYFYKPILLIELDGSSHYSPAKYGIEAFERQKNSDQYKNRLANAFNIPQIRYCMNDNDLITKDDRDKIKTILQKYFIVS